MKNGLRFSGNPVITNQKTVHIVVHSLFLILWKNNKKPQRTKTPENLPTCFFPENRPNGYCEAVAAFTSPYPYCVSLPAVPRSVAVEFNLARTSSYIPFRPFVFETKPLAIISAATPATCGEAMDVPDPNLYQQSPLRQIGCGLR